MKEIPLTQGYIALVDDEDYERVAQFKWYADPDKNGTIYAKRQIKLHGGGPRQRAQRLHRFIMGIIDRKVKVDHKDHNGLNCQKHNLRACTDQQNCRNRKKHKKLTSKYKGVSKHKEGKWVANIMVNGVLKYLGIFIRERDAALAYDKAARINFGVFAHLNFVQETA